MKGLQPSACSTGACFVNNLTEVVLECWGNLGGVMVAGEPSASCFCPIMSTKLTLLGSRFTLTWMDTQCPKDYSH